MKWFFVLLLALIVFGGGALFSYLLFFKQEIAVRQEQRGEVTPAPTPDFGGPEFEAAAKLRQEGKLVEARGALAAFIQKYPNGGHVEEAKDLLGEVNIDILLSRTPSPEKQEYIVKPGDVLQKIANKVKSTPELIMRMNNLSGTMLHIGDRLFFSHPQFSIVIQRKPKLVVVLNNGAFFKQYHIREEKLPGQAGAESHDQSGRSDGVAGRQARRLRHARIHRQHALDPNGRPGLHTLCRARFRTSKRWNSTAALRVLASPPPMSKN